MDIEMTKKCAESIQLTPQAKDAVMHSVIMLMYELQRMELEVAKTRIAIIELQRQKLRSDFPESFADEQSAVKP